MAKGGSLFGAADPTLVGMSYKEAMSNMPANLGAMYKQREKNLTDFTTGIQELFKDEDQEIWNDFEDDQWAKALETLQTSPNINDAALEDYHNTVKYFENLYKGEDDEIKKSKIMAKMNQYASTIQKNSDIFNKLITAGANDDFIANGNNEEKKLLNLIRNDYLNNSNEASGKYDAELNDNVYTLPGTDTKITLRELERRLNIKDNAVNATIQGVINDVTSSAKATNRPWDARWQKDIESQLEAKMNTNNDIINVGDYKFEGMDYSVRDMITGNVADGWNNPILNDIYNALDGADGTVDGMVNGQKRSTYATAENGKALGQEIMKNPKLYKEIISSTIADIVGGHAFKLGGYGKDKGVTDTSTSTDISNDQSVFDNRWYTDPTGKAKSIHGRDLESLWNKFNEGRIELSDGVYIRDKKTNVWTNTKDSKKIFDGNEMIDMAQESIGGFPIKDYFKQFKGQGKGVWKSPMEDIFNPN